MGIVTSRVISWLHGMNCFTYRQTRSRQSRIVEFVRRLNSYTELLGQFTRQYEINVHINPWLKCYAAEQMAKPLNAGVMIIYVLC